MIRSEEFAIPSKAVAFVLNIVHLGLVALVVGGFVLATRLPLVKLQELMQRR